MPYYETVFIARQDLTEAQVKTLTEGFSKVITDMGGQIHKIAATRHLRLHSPVQCRLCGRRLVQCHRHRPHLTGRGLMLGRAAAGG